MTDAPAPIEAEYRPRDPKRDLQASFALRTYSPRNRGGLGQSPYPEWLEKIYFLIWLGHCNRNPRETAARAETFWELYAAEDQPYAPVPANTLLVWTKRHDWSGKATTLLATNFPKEWMDLLARAIEGGKTGLETVIAIARGDYAGPEHNQRAVQNMLDAAKHATIMAGIGTFGTRDRIAAQVRATTDAAIDFQGLTQQELARITLQAIQGGKQGMEERKR